MVRFTSYSYHFSFFSKCTLGVARKWKIRKSTLVWDFHLGHCASRSLITGLISKNLELFVFPPFWSSWSYWTNQVIRISEKYLTYTGCHDMQLKLSNKWHLVVMFKDPKSNPSTVSSQLIFILMDGLFPSDLKVLTIWNDEIMKKLVWLCK